MNGLRFAGIAELRALLRERSVSSEELAKTCLKAIADSESLGAFNSINSDRVIADAREADRAIDAGSTAGLLGIPVAIKDLIDEVGVVTTAGSSANQAKAAVDDAEVVRRLRSAGAVIVGRTQLHEFAFGPTSENTFSGNAINPWNRSRIAGGSSGGSAVAVAAGLCTAALGTDTGGSIRIPASLCGVTGLKATYGRVSRRGVFPLAWTADHVGPFARSAADCAAVLSAIAGYDPSDPGCADVPFAEFEAASVEVPDGLRVGAVRLPDTSFVEDSVRSALGEATSAIRGIAATVVEVEFPQLQIGFAAAAATTRAEAASVHGKNLAARPAFYGADVRTRLRVGQFIPAAAYIEAQAARRRLGAELASLFDTVDLLLLPATPIAAPEIGKTFDPYPGATEGSSARALLTALTSAFNMTGAPAISIPCGFDADGLPIGLQIIGRHWEEHLVLALARAYQRVTDWHLRQPPTSLIQRSA